MTYDFFANDADKITILEFIFKQTDLKVFDSYSAYGEEIVEYKNIDQISSNFDLVTGVLAFNLWDPKHKGHVLFRKVNLDPKRCNGYTFRFSTNGWGLIQLQFGGLTSNDLYKSHIGHFNEKGASKWEGISSFNGDVNQWDWLAIQKTSRNLKYYISNKLATRKVGGFGILPGADSLEKQGIKFRL